jgi:hypothetical protein
MTMTTIDDIYRPAHALHPLPGEHTEAVTLDLTTTAGEVLLVEGRVTVLEGTRVVFIDIPHSLPALSRYDASDAIQWAVSDGRVGSDVVRSAVDRGFTVKGLPREVQS